MAHPYIRIIFGHKKEWSNDTSHNMNEPWKYTKWRKPHTKTLYIMILWYVGGGGGGRGKEEWHGLLLAMTVA